MALAKIDKYYLLLN